MGTAGRTGGSARLALVVAAAGAAIALAYAARPRFPADERVKVVEIQLGPGVELRPALAKGGRGQSEPFSDMISRMKPYAAINGTYYDERMRPVGDILIDGRLASRGGQRNAIAVTRAGNVVFIRRGKRGFRWSGYRWGVAAGPRLVHKGRVALDPVADGFAPESLSKRAWRSGIGIGRKGKLLLVTAKADLTLEQFAKVMLDLGAEEAMNLDGGGACGLYHRGRTLAAPALPMTNIVVVHVRNPR